MIKFLSSLLELEKESEVALQKSRNKMLKNIRSDFGKESKPKKEEASKDRKVS